ncbi:MAG: thioredoxin domain-containing protein [Patescibacteria group bacterium]|mgnify:CR=1 FL=1
MEIPETPPAMFTPPVRPPWTYAALPVALVIAAVLIAGSLVYTKGGPQKASGGPKTGTINYTVDDLKIWAGKIKGIDKKAFATCLDSDKYAARVKQDMESGSALGVDGTPSFFINGTPLVGAQPIDQFRAAIEQAKTNPGKKISLGAEDHILGMESAPVTIVEYSDFQCPFCRTFFDQTYGQLKKEYIDTGVVKLAYRHFPLGFHAAAQKSAEATECANDQGKFWEMHDAIFSLQAK